LFANRFTAFIDACSLTGALKRNLLLTLAEAEFFRIRWSSQVLDEVETAVTRILEKKGFVDANERARRARTAMEKAFEEADVTDYEDLEAACGEIPDPSDAHVVAAALKTRAETIVTDNLRHFPADVIAKLGMEARSTDAFLADTIALDPGRAVAAIRQMRLRLSRPDKSAEALLLDMEASGLVDTADVLRPHVLSL
jgi:predicted nucleic acid-binding protein